MRKTDKKIDNQLRTALTDVCETALKEIDGFQWLTHLVNYANFPESLKVVCIFDSNENLALFLSKGSKKELTSLIQVKLHGMGVNLKNVVAHISYDTEENCEKQHNGKWANRLS
ncbi:Fis family transcriptional regulator [Thalassotalea sp. 42_200_T64]|nr:Fis family transcriptional regulator [Thalassotalea sp. 42_200_T64]